MELDESTLRDGLEFICGTWQVDYIVNAFSNDLSHIPASEWKSDDGSDFSRITYEFTEDHVVTMRDATTGKEEKGTWEQTGYCDYHYTLNGFMEIPEGPFRSNAEKLLIQDGALCFSIGFLAIGMKKIAEGHVTTEPDIGDITPSAEDEDLCEIVGRYAIYKTMSVVGGKFGMFSGDEVKAEYDKKLASGECDKREYAQAMAMFDGFIEFTEDHKVLSWMKIPEGVSDDDIKAALEAGEIEDLKDGYFCDSHKEWKAVGGKYYYDTKQHREVMGKVQSPWDELVFDDEGLLPFADGFMLLKRI